MEIAKAYEPKQAEQDHYERWEKSGFFAPEINQDPDAPKYSIVIPPPNVTGSLHMGHALQHTIMDVLIRWKRMQGYRTLWLAGHRPRRNFRSAKGRRAAEKGRAQKPARHRPRGVCPQGLGLEGSSTATR